MSNEVTIPDYLFEVSWEICNKVGGIHTVVATKAISLLTKYNSNYILIGPDIVRPETDNPEFVEDKQLYGSWRQHAEAEGLRIRIGRWQINGNPIAVLIDFSNWINKKDDVFSKFWEIYKLDSISGQWDYIEPALFGYVAGKVIESFVLFNMTKEDKIVAQFHEWMTGTGILYLKDKLPQVATIFTTHATVLGRSLAGNNKPLYKNLNIYDPDQIAKEFNVISKQSLEKLSALHADAFTTVSELTSRECKQFFGKEVDLVTPNGFEDTFIPPQEEYTIKRQTARNKFLAVAESLLGYSISDDALLVATSGRYEFRNKGLDLFIDALAEINNTENLKREIVAFILIPANHYGARKDLADKLTGGNIQVDGSKYLTHNLHDEEYDPILKRIHKGALKNNQEQKVKVIFVPSYLNGNDGIFNLPYYDLLIGLDLTVFASYYEPWGYTPLESLAFSIPTVTTSLTGFGLWVNTQIHQIDGGIAVIDRNDDNDVEVVKNIAAEIIKKYKYTFEECRNSRNNAFAISRIALWNSLIDNYYKTYSIALEQTLKRRDKFVELQEKQTEKVYEEFVSTGNEPKWNRIIIKSKLPEQLQLLDELSQNLWWTWDHEAESLFETIDPVTWDLCGHNPAILFEQISFNKLKKLSKDQNYIEKLQNVYSRYQAYMEAKKEMQGPKIAYFSMEYGIHDSIKLYSGGLGILAGDYLKEASDSMVNIVAVGILYRYGYFDQMLTLMGEQQAQYEYQHFTKIPVKPVRDESGNFKIVNIALPGRIMCARIWRLDVGRIHLYLLDTDIECNTPEDRTISHHLYGGDNENRLRQELLLGIGGIRVLNTLGIYPDLYHSNEGHSAFIGLERIRNLVQLEQLTFEEAKEIVRASTVFTTHTPVPAGHDAFEEDLLRKYIGHYPERLKISWNYFMSLGRANPNDWHEKFNMSYLASHLAQEINGVSMLHGTVTRDILVKLWPGYLQEELHIDYVTNGVHLPTWKAHEWNPVYSKVFSDKNSDFRVIDNWSRFYEIPDNEIWDVKQQLRKKLIVAVKERFKENWIKRHEDPKQIITIRDALSENALTVCFARRFATYKRAHLLFRNLERLAKLINNPDRPIQFIFAGKAHPQDKAGQDLIKYIIEISKRPEFLGKILFLQNYDIGLAKLLVQGADIWLNTPTRPLEASGTSGEKAVMNGTLHFSVLDGWWVEGYKPEAGWALTNERTYDNQAFQDDLDAEIIYSLFEQEIVPLFYKRDHDGLPVNWIKYIKNSFVQVAPNFTTTRMITDYKNKFYTPLYEHTLQIKENEYSQVKKMASWKRKIRRSWDNIEVLDVKMYDKKTETLDAGKDYTSTVILDLNEISSENVGVEMILTENYTNIVLRKEFDLVDNNAGQVKYEATFSIQQPGTFTYGLRIFPKNPLLPNRMDFPLIRWI
ncbi:MAG: alpha-glucan family phosphorylase [Bacteroidales bacterium]|nr:alpha-glucan family phosphorylase [Bacteroidales bacterium]